LVGQLGQMIFRHTSENHLTNLGGSWV